MAELCNRFELHANQITEFKKQLLAHVAESFEAGSKPVKVVDLVPVHAKIGQLTLKNDFLESALTQAGLLTSQTLQLEQHREAAFKLAASHPKADLSELAAQVGRGCVE